jgi:hypothetical protein
VLARRAGPGGVPWAGAESCAVRGAGAAASAARMAPAPRGAGRLLLFFARDIMHLPRVGKRTRPIIVAAVNPGLD